MHGRRDRIVPPCLAEEMHRRIEGSQLTLFDGGHVFPIMKSAEFAKAVEVFRASSVPRA
jgi:pimeloyl-ACP methyl ester carboxylesterase